ncbi:MAG TPA: hypothetical protein VIM56_06295 [Rhizomicrobium sp.]
MTTETREDILEDLRALRRKHENTPTGDLLGDVLTWMVEARRGLAQAAANAEAAAHGPANGAIWNDQMVAAMGLSLPIDEEWLKASGFKWAQLDRQPSRHWMVWLGDAVRENQGDGRSFTSYEDVGIEVAADYNGEWFCWLRSDAAGLYHRFIHIRHLKYRIELVRLIEAITGQPWTPQQHAAGNVLGPKGFAHMERWARRADVQIQFDAIRRGASWHDMERDPNRAGARAIDLWELIDRQQGKIKNKAEGAP